jgi:hypothetical protein
LKSTIDSRTARVLRISGTRSKRDGSLFHLPRRRNHIYLQRRRCVHSFCLLHRALGLDAAPREVGSGVRLDVCRDTPKGPIRGWRGVSTPTSTDRILLIRHHIGQNYVEAATGLTPQGAPLIPVLGYHSQIREPRRTQLLPFAFAIALAALRVAPRV